MIAVGDNVVTGELDWASGKNLPVGLGEVKDVFELLFNCRNTRKDVRNCFHELSGLFLFEKKHWKAGDYLH